MKSLETFLKLFIIFAVLDALSCTSHISTDSYSTSNSSGSTTTSAPEIKEDPSVQIWKDAEKAAKKLSASLVKSILPHALRMSETLNLTTSCSRGLIKFLTGIKQLKNWAFQMVDSSALVPHGILRGSISALGDYDMCIETDVPGHFRGQYCLVEIDPPTPPRRPFVAVEQMIPEFVNITHPESATTEFLKKAMYFYFLNIRSAICVPSTCSRQEIEMIASKAVESTGIEFKVLVPNCEVKVEQVTLNKSEISIITVLAFLLFLAVTATITDVTLKLKSEDENYQAKLSVAIRYLICFSLYTNACRLLKKDESPNSIKIFHGMKVITLLWVILNHSYYYINYQALGSLLNARIATTEGAFQFIANGFLNVETFFFISAVLVSYGIMKAKQEKINIFLFIFRRVWRLAPPFMLVIACLFLIPHLGSGPVWKETVIDGLVEKCKKKWWTNLLFFNNFVPNSEMCMNWSWYIPVDTHLYLISLAVLIPLKKNPRLAFLMNGAFFIIGTAITAANHVYFKLHPTAITAFVHPEDIDYFVDRGYFRTYVHCASYCVGLTVGYILATRQKIRIPLGWNIAGWITSFVLSLSVVYGVYDWNLGNVPSLAVSTLYTCTNKLVWALALAWVTITCMTGNGGFVTTILSWEVFVPLSRLTYMTYIIHPIIQIMYMGSTKTAIRMEHKTILFMYLSNIVLGFMCACILSLLFESPFMAVEKLFFSPRPKREETKDKIDEFKFTDSERSYSQSFKENGVCAINIKKLDSNH
ncbi:nose resistant to fluoxetine protein 6 [Caerostris darwini]|uniref:Nose resistant to fluoxetine protein 6 n=1 Tax=Caerostris darwini TaxID=1538125 RepID=A0AAV4RNG7_9ARAC|nr:nose resistant to fluoxetine protein 6 [Caerostris darwini]